MPRCTVLSLAKIMTFIGLFCALSSSSWADTLRNKLIFIQSNTVIEEYDLLSKAEKDTWFKRHLTLTNTDTPESYLLAAKHLYFARKYQQATQQVETLLTLIDKRPTVLLANAYYLNAFNTSLGLRQFEKSVPMFQQAIETLESVKGMNNKANAIELSIASNSRLGSLYLFLKQHEHARVYIDTAIGNAKVSGNITYLISPTLELAKYYIAIKSYELAEQQLIKSYDLALESNSNQRPDILQQLSRYYRNNNHHNLAIEYAIKAVKYYQKHPDIKNDLAAAYNNLAITYEASGDLNTALVHYLNTIELLKDHPHNYFLALATHNTGMIYEQQNKLNDALIAFKKANVSFSKIGHNYFLMSSNLSIADVLIKLKRFDQSINFAQKALKTANQRKQADAQINALEFLAKAYMQTKQFEQATTAFNQLTSLKDTLTKTLEEKLNNKAERPVADHVKLRAKLADFRSKINESSFIITQQEQTLSFLELVLLMCSGLIVVLIIFLKRSYNHSKLLKSSTSRYAGSAFISLHDEKLLLQITNEKFIKNQYIIAIELPIINSLIHLMGLDKANELKEKLVHGLSTFVGRPFYQVSEDTFIFAKTPDTMHTIEQRFSLLMDCYTKLMPQQLISNTHNHPVLLGAVKRTPQKAALNLIQAKNIINLSLTALSAVRENSSVVASENWLVLSEKDGNSTALFTCATRKEWLNLAHNNMLTIETGIKNNISWLTIPHFDKQ